jgi:hypothetical protein
MNKTIAKRLFAIALVAFSATLLSPTSVRASERVEVTQFNFGALTTRALFPGVNVGGPGVQGSEWYPVYLVRDPYACALEFPEDHLLVFNIRLSSPDPSYHFTCPLLVEGFGIYGDESDIFPRIGNLRGDNVPVYFVHKDDAYLGMTWGEFSGLLDAGCVLQGETNRYHEILQPGSPDPSVFPGGAKVPSFNISLSGYLEDGTRFTVHTVGQLVPGPTFPNTVVRTYQIMGLDDKEYPCSPP